MSFFEKQMVCPDLVVLQASGQFFIIDDFDLLEGLFARHLHLPVRLLGLLVIGSLLVLLLSGQPLLLLLLLNLFHDAIDADRRPSARRTQTRPASLAQNSAALALASLLLLQLLLMHCGADVLG